MSEEVSKWFANGKSNLLTNEIYWGYNNPLTNLLLTSWDIQVLSSPPLPPAMVAWHLEEDPIS